MSVPFESGAKSGGLSLSVTVDTSAAHGMLAAVEPVAAVLMAALHWDTIKYHKLTILKRAGNQWPGGRQGQKFLAMRLKGYGSKAAKGQRPMTMAQAQGESFARGTIGDNSEYMSLLETGGEVAVTAVPIAALKAKGMRRSAMLADFKKKLGERAYTITRSGLIIERLKRRSVIVGVIKNSRRQRAILGFHSSFGSIWPKQQTKYNRLIELMVRSISKAQEYVGVMRQRERARDAGKSKKSAARLAELAAKAAEIEGRKL